MLLVIRIHLTAIQCASKRAYACANLITVMYDVCESYQSRMRTVERPRRVQATQPLSRAQGGGHPGGTALMLTQSYLFLEYIYI